MSPTLHLHICFGIALILGGLTLAEVRAEPTGWPSRAESCPSVVHLPSPPVLSQPWKVGLDREALQITSEGTRPWSARFATEEVTIDGRQYPVSAGHLLSVGKERRIVRPFLIDHFEERPDGIKQSWTVRDPELGHRATHVSLKLSIGGLTPWIPERADSVLLLTRDRRAALELRGFRAWDRTGRDRPVKISKTSNGLCLDLVGDPIEFPLFIDPLIAEPANWSFEGGGSGARLGSFIAGGTDITGDGIADFVLAAPDATTTEVGAGQVFVFAGTPIGFPSTSPVWVIEGATPGEQLGASVSLGDLNGDAIADLVIGAPGAGVAGVQRGSVGVFFGPISANTAPGSLAAANWIAEGPHSGSRFGASTLLTELDGDGTLDLIIGVPQAEVSGVPTGNVTVYLGGNSPILDGVFQGIRPEGAFGAALSGSKMAPGTIVVGAPLVSNSVPAAGAAYLLTRLATASWALRWWIEGAAADEHLGSSVAGPADLNGDGALDLFVGVPHADGGRGRVLGYTDLPGLNGGASTPSTLLPRWNLVGGQLGEALGSAISIATSVDDDPRPDLLIGAPMFDNGSTSAVRAGRAFVVTGRRLADSSLFSGAAIPQDIEDVSAWSFEGDSGELGRSVAGIGDIDGNGFGDLLLGAPVQSGTLSDSGLVELHTGFSDCNENAVPDPIDLLFADCNSNGLLDECEPDCDQDLIPDDCEPDCDGDGIPDDCEEPRDCNENGLHDDCEVATLLVADCDNDMIPDECEPDCDQDFTPDDCEPDCDGDGIPDDCEEPEDCNSNGIHDDCEMALHPEDDCNHNSIHDDCEPDCDQDGLPDDCEELFDCNHNLIHDDCDPDCDGDGVPDDCELDCDGDGLPSGCDPDETCIDQLDCSSVDSLSCLVTITWVNGGVFDEIRVFRSGHFITALPGDATMVTVHLPEADVNFEICLVPRKDGQAGTAACCIAKCPVVPPQPQDLVCTLTDPCTCQVTLSWINPTDYTVIQIFLNGELLVELPGANTQTSLFLLSDAPREICIEGVKNQVASLPTCCSISCPSIAETAPTMVDCGLPNTDCMTTVTWENTSQYSEIRLKVNGDLVSTLGGSATSADITLPLPGMNSVCIEATTICGVITSEVCCSANCVSPVPAPENPVCTLNDPCSCEATLTWVNPVSYDQIEIFVNGTSAMLLPGTAISATLTLPPAPTANLCVQGILNQVASPQSCCDLACPNTQPLAPEQVNCPEPAVGSSSCSVEVTWQNPTAYGEIIVSVAGNQVETLSGDATSVVVSLPMPVNSEVPIICLDGTTVCGQTFPQVCCVAYASDCDGDGIPNFCEEDCDGDGTPDDCQVTEDCNGNQIPDSCDIANGTSDDSNMDGIPDECLPPLAAASFVRGDCNGDQLVSLADVVDLLGWLFVFQGVPLCAAAGDATADGVVQLGDGIYLLQYLFGSGAEPPHPYPLCGSDVSTPLDCSPGAHCP